MVSGQLIKLPFALSMKSQILMSNLIWNLFDKRNQQKLDKWDYLPRARQMALKFRCWYGKAGSSVLAVPGGRVAVRILGELRIQSRHLIRNIADSRRYTTSCQRETSLRWRCSGKVWLTACRWQTNGAGTAWHSWRWNSLRKVLW